MARLPLIAGSHRCRFVVAFLILISMALEGCQSSKTGMPLDHALTLEIRTPGLPPRSVDDVLELFGQQEPEAASCSEVGGPEDFARRMREIYDKAPTRVEILGLRLDADWVVLSACNTANGAGAGAEAFSGLGRAFFYAGARALLLTHWPVETSSARALTTGVFRRQAADPSLSRARALQQTVNALIDEGGIIDPKTGTMVSGYAHPIFWAPFALVGDSGAN